MAYRLNRLSVYARYVRRRIRPIINRVPSNLLQNLSLISGILGFFVTIFFSYLTWQLAIKANGISEQSLLLSKNDSSIIQEIGTLNKILASQDKQLSRLEYLASNSQKQIDIQSKQLDKINYQKQILTKQYNLDYQSVSENYNAKYLEYTQAVSDMKSLYSPEVKKFLVNQETVADARKHIEFIKGVVNKELGNSYIISEPELLDKWQRMQTICYNALEQIPSTATASTTGVAIVRIANGKRKVTIGSLSKDSTEIAENGLNPSGMKILTSADRDKLTAESALHFIDMFNVFYVYNTKHISKVTGGK